jgi:hypothetical protein
MAQMPMPNTLSNGTSTRVTLYRAKIRHTRRPPRMTLHVAALALTAQLLILAPPPAASQEIQNLTGLPAYPRLRTATMDRIPKTDVLGHWCYRLTAETVDSLDTVQEWYRRALVNASETDLTHDPSYKEYTELSGIKLSRNLDYVDIYKSAPQATTSIQLVKCSPVT